ILQAACNTPFLILVGRLMDQVATEYGPGRDLVLLEKFNEVVSVDICFRSYCNNKTEPTRVTILRGTRKNQHILEVCQTFAQPRPVALSRGYEIRQFLELRQTDCSLHVCHLQVVADMRINVFMIVAERQAS